MLRLPLTSLLAATVLLTLSINTGHAQITRTSFGLKTPTQDFEGPGDDSEPIDIPGGGTVQIKTAVGFERWLPEGPPTQETIITGGSGWFYRNNLSMLELNYVYPMMGFRPVDIEVEEWAGSNTVFSAVFVQSTGTFQVSDSVVMVAQEEDVRDFLFGGEWSNYRAIDLEVAQRQGSIDLEADVVELTALDHTIAVLLVPNEGNQYTPEWDFIVHATPIDLLVWGDTFAGEMRIIDNEISFNAPDNYLHDAEHLEDVVYSQIMVSNEGIEHVETSIFQYTSFLDLWALEQEGWQLIDSERNIPLMYEDFPEWCGAFTGVFVQKPNSTEFWEELNGYSDEEETSLEPKRMIDLELVPDGGSFLLDELYLIYD